MKLYINPPMKKPTRTLSIILLVVYVLVCATASVLLWLFVEQAYGISVVVLSVLLLVVILLTMFRKNSYVEIGEEEIKIVKYKFPIKTEETIKKSSIAIAEIVRGLKRKLQEGKWSDCQTNVEYIVVSDHKLDFLFRVYLCEESKKALEKYFTAEAREKVKAPNTIDEDDDYGLTRY